MLLGLWTVVVALSPCRHVHVEATLSSDLRTVAGQVTCEVAASGALAVATYPRILRRADTLNDISRPWYYPQGFDAADMQLSRDGSSLDADGPWQPLGDVAAGTRVALTFATRVPERNGTFGRRDGTAWLLGGWHPSFGREGEPLDSVGIDYDVRVPEGFVGFVGTTPFGHGSARRRVGTVTAREVSLLVAPEAHVRVSPAGIVVAPGRAAVDEIGRTLDAGWGFASPVAASVLVVVAPLREHLVERFASGIAVSDKAFSLLPFEMFWRFHRLRIWRAQFQAMAESGGRTALDADIVAAALRDRIWKARYGDKAYLPDLLSSFAVIPEIEALIYAPQISFVDAYFEAVDERRASSLELDAYSHPMPRGKLLYEKLVDRLGESQTQALVDAYLDARVPFMTLLAARHGRDVVQALGAWIGPVPRLDYVVTDAGIEARGPDAARVIEPLTARVVDDEGDEHLVTRLGPGPLDVATPSSVELDPHGRLVELEHAPGEDPRYNDRTPPRWRFLLNDVSGLVAVTNQQLQLNVDFSLRRVHDLRYRFDFDLASTPEAYGATVTGSYGFGRELTPLRLAERVGIGLRGQRLRVGRDSGDPGYVGTLNAFYLYDTRLGAFSAFEGQGLVARVSGSLGRLDRGGTRRYGQATLSGYQLFPFGFYHALLVRLRGDWLFGDAPEQLNLRLGDRYVAGRGFEPDEASAPRRATLSLEYRHAIAVDANVDFFGLFTWTRLEGALFADALYLPVRRHGCHRDTFADAGYGLRFLGDLLNVSPSSLQVDVGVPFGRCGDEADRPPVAIYLAFVQSFLVF